MRVECCLSFVDLLGSVDLGTFPVLSACGAGATVRPSRVGLVLTRLQRQMQLLLPDGPACDFAQPRELQPKIILSLLPCPETCVVGLPLVLVLASELVGRGDPLIDVVVVKRLGLPLDVTQLRRRSLNLRCPISVRLVGFDRVPQGAVCAGRPVV